MLKTLGATPRQVVEEPSRPAKASARIGWPWIAFICVLLVASGAARYWRDWQFQKLSRVSEESPFPLNTFPRTLGSWHMVEGTEQNLEPEIAWIAGASDHLEWTYADEKTGEKACVLIIYGLAKRVWPHVPDVCYPTTGFKQVTDTNDIAIPIAGSSRTALFRFQGFAKYATGQRDYREVYHSFRNAGKWGVDMGKNWKMFRYSPEMFKVQVQVQGSGGAGDQVTESVHQLLGLITREIEERVADVH